MTKFILDSGDPQEYKLIKQLAEDNGFSIWGSTTNPSLVAKTAKTRIKHKLTLEDAFKLQKELVLEILELVPGAVSAEVYADANTLTEEMIKQGLDIASWNNRVVVKLPTTISGFKARTKLRETGILTNNTLVFSKEQIIAICLHESLVQNEANKNDMWPPFISPFVGRLDDIGENGLDLVKDGISIKNAFPAKTWMLEASVRGREHLERGIQLGSELITAPYSVYEDYFKNNKNIDNNSGKEQNYSATWKIPDYVAAIDSIEKFYSALENHTLDIRHDLTDKGLVKFASDWNELITQ